MATETTTLLWMFCKGTRVEIVHGSKAGLRGTIDAPMPRPRTCRRDAAERPDVPTEISVVIDGGARWRGPWSRCKPIREDQ